MLDFGLFMVFSVLETFAAFFLAFKIFKIDLYPKEILFAGLIMAFFSYELRNTYGLIQIDIIVQYIFVFCFLWLLFRIHIFYAAIIAGTAYQAYTFIQIFYYYIFKESGLFTLHIFLGLSIEAYILQVLTVVTAISLGVYFEKKRKGFDFIPDKPYGKVRITIREKILFALNIPTVGIVISVMHFAEWRFFFLAPLLYGLLLYSYLYLAYKKDRNIHEHIKL